ncbi:DNA polymerase, partial [Fervidobacterium sp.]
MEDLASLEGVLPLLAREEVVGFDLETTGLDPHTAKVRLVSLYLPSEGRAVVLDLFRLGEGVVEKLFSGEGPNLVGHNLAFDLTFLMARGLYPLGLPWDTGLVDQALGHRARMRPLEEVAREAGILLDKSLQASDWGGPLSQEQIEYAGLDSWAAWAIRQAQEPQVNRLGLRQVVAVEMAALPAVALMRLRGVPFDPGIWEEAVEEAEAHKEAALARLREFEAGLLKGAVNWDSPQQALKALEALGLDLPDTREETLAQHGEHPAVQALLEYRAWAKRLSTYGREWGKYLHPKTGRIHPSWHQIGAETGRMACSKP